MTEREAAGFKNLDMGFIFCSSCFQDYLRKNYVPESAKKEFTPIYKGENWAIGPSCTRCSKKIIW